MPKAYSEDLLWRVVALIWYYGYAQREAAELLCMHVNTVARVMQRFTAGQPLAKNEPRAARPRLLTDQDLYELRKMVLANDTLYLDELRDALKLVCSKTVSRRTVLRGLHLLGLNRKRLHSIAKEQREYQRVDFAVRCLTEFKYYQYLFVDESHFDKRCYSRKWGRAFRGRRTTSRTIRYRDTPWSLVPVLSYTGLITWYIVEGGLNAELFLDFIQRCVVPYLQPYPAPHSVVVMDNFSTHHNAAVLAAITAVGAKVHHTAAYSCDMTPIELVAGVDFTRLSGRRECA